MTGGELGVSIDMKHPTRNQMNCETGDNNHEHSTAFLPYTRSAFRLNHPNFAREGLLE
jgi:hypothetical protein